MQWPGASQSQMKSCGRHVRQAEADSRRACDSGRMHRTFKANKKGLHMSVAILFNLLVLLAGALGSFWTFGCGALVAVLSRAVGLCDKLKAVGCCVAGALREQARQSSKKLDFQRPECLASTVRHTVDAAISRLAISTLLDAKSNTTLRWRGEDSTAPLAACHGCESCLKQTSK